MGTTSHRREPARLRAESRRPGGCERAAGRLHAALHATGAACHQPIFSFQHRVRSARVCPGFDHGPATLRARGPPEGPCHDPPGTDRLRQGESRQAQLPVAGIGSPPHLFGEMLKTRADIRLVHVPYKGLEPALNDLLGGHIELMFHELSSTLEHIKAGKLKVLAAGSDTRLLELPDVMAISEVLPGFVATTWFAVVAPPKTPLDGAANPSQAIAEAIRLPEVAERLRSFSYRPVGMSPAETAAFLRQEAERWHEVIMAAGLNRT